MSKKTVLVTGSSGFIGKHLTKKLSSLGYEIISLDSKNGYDLTIREKLNDIPVFDLMIHLAGSLFVPESYKNPYKFYHDNIISTLNALELCRINNARFIYASSYVYGNPQSLPIDENHLIQPSNPYMQSKLIGENLCEGYYRDFKTPIIILRPFNIIGTGQHKNFLIPKIIHQIQSGKVSLFDPRPKRDFVYITDVVDAFIAAANYRKSDFEVFNIGSGISYSVEEVIRILKKISKKKFMVEYTNEYRQNEILDTIANINKAKRLLNWTPKIDIKTALKQIFESQI